MLTFRTLCKESLEDCVIKENEQTISGFINTEESYADFLDSLKTLGFSYSVRSSKIHCSDDQKEGLRIFFNYDSGKLAHVPQIDFFGAPFTIEKVSHLECSQGPKYHPIKLFAAEVPGHPKPARKRKPIHKTKKLDCPAVMTVKCVRIYPDFTTADTKRKKASVSKTLKESLEKEMILNSYLRYYIKASLPECHNHSTVRSQVCEEIHPELITEIKRITKQGISATKHVKLLLQQHVGRKFSDKVISSRLKKTLFPDDSVIRAQVYHSIFLQKRTFIDQGSLEQLIIQWQNKDTDDFFFYRPFKDISVGDVTTLLFCHQTKWQQKLLLRYGRVCLLDAAYKTVQYPLPLYFLAVKTNIDYIVVGTFAVQAENTATIAEALSVFKEWLPAWRPKFWMTDFSEMDIGAVEETFDGSTVYVCAFHREQTWQRWVMQNGNVISGDPEEMLRKWRTVAASSDNSDFERSIHEMNSSDIMIENPNASQYFATQWLPGAHRWVQAFCERECVTIINTNNGIESQNRVLRHPFLCPSSDKSLSGKLKTIIDSYLPNVYREYWYTNSTIEMFSSEIPSFLSNRPQHFIKHVLARISAAKSAYCKNSISEISEGIFGVQSFTDETKCFCVNFHEVSCTCLDFETFRFPCEHFCAVFEFLPTWSFLQLNPEYLNSPYITLDSDHAYYSNEIITLPPAVVVDKNFDQTVESSLMSDNQILYTVTINTSQQLETCSILTAQQNFRDELTMLLEMSCNCNDAQFLEDTTLFIREKRKLMEEKIKTSAGLPLSNSEDLVDSQCATPCQVKAKYKILPLHKKSVQKAQ